MHSLTHSSHTLKTAWRRLCGRPYTTWLRATDSDVSQSTWGCTQRGESKASDRTLCMATHRQQGNTPSRGTPVKKKIEVETEIQNSGVETEPECSVCGWRGRGGCWTMSPMSAGGGGSGGGASALRMQIPCMRACVRAPPTAITKLPFINTSSVA